MRLLVSKVGSVFHARDLGSNAKGEQGETEGLMRHLIEQGHEVIYFGRARGLERIHGVTYIESTRIGPGMYLGQTYTYEDQCRAADIDEEQLRAIGAHEADAWIQVFGYSAPSLMNNKTLATPQNAAILYIAPILMAQHRLRIPCIGVNNDPRTYLKSQEAANQWPDLLPIALLDQSEHEKQRIIGGVDVIQRARYAKCESWGYLESVENRRETLCTIVAHAHISDGCRKRARDDSWRNVLLGAFEELPEMRVYGKGWNHFSMYDEYPDRFPGCIEGGAVAETLAACEFSPCVAADHGFYTGKPYVLVASGVVPLMYGDGTDPFTWDPLSQLVPFDHPTRVVNPGDLARVVRTLDYDEQLTWFKSILKPDFSVLDTCLDELQQGRLTQDPDGWWNDYGGYRLL